MIDLILFPSSYFDVKKVDKDLVTEYEAVLATGLFDVIIFGYEKWFNEDKLVLTSIPKERRKAVYRGWMMKPDKYEAFCNRSYWNMNKTIAPNLYIMLQFKTTDINTSIYKMVGRLFFRRPIFYLFYI